MKRLIAGTKKIMCLCNGRHSIPQAVDGSIFPNSLNPLDVSGMEETAEGILQDVSELTLYVTGLSVALIAVINVCRKNNIKLTLMHYNRDTDDYYPQTVI